MRTRTASWWRRRSRWSRRSCRSAASTSCWRYPPPRAKRSPRFRPQRCRPLTRAERAMRVRFWGTRGSIPVGLTVADMRDRLAQALVAASGRRFESFGEAHDFVKRELPFALSHTFGGHTSCVELVTGSDEYFVCDMGSGARAFGEHVLARQGGRRATVHIFMSHMHWDHIMGFPFFGPAYVPGMRLRIHGCHDVLEQAFRLQQSPPCFPVTFDQLGASIEFVSLRPGEAREVSGMRVTP